MSEAQTIPLIAPDLLEILCCPETHQKLRLAEPAVVEKLNSLVSAGTLRNHGGKPVAEPLDAGLVRDDGKYVYPIRHNLPILLVDEAIPL